jgi:hypothetical protein
MLIAQQDGPDRLNQTHVLRCERRKAPLAGLVGPLRQVELAQATLRHDELGLLNGGILYSNRIGGSHHMLTSSEIVHSFS